MQLNSVEWTALLAKVLASQEYKSLTNFIDQEYCHSVCYPPKSQIFRALELCPPYRLKVVIVGQDPYHNSGQANGLCFSCDNSPLPPSLVNIYKEIEAEYEGVSMLDGNLEYLARQGVLLLNTCLTVREHQPNSHKGKGWELFTKEVLDIANSKDNIVFMLWGSRAQILIPPENQHDTNLYLTSPHPSPLSAYRGFLGNGHFKQCNKFLTDNGKTAINWGSVV